MADVLLTIGGRSYTVGCRAGGEDRLRELGRRVEAKVEEARAAVGSASEVRQLLFASLLLADDAGEAVPDPELTMQLETVATRIEALADALEGTPPSD